MGRSTAYWSTNLYSDPAEEPGATAPLRDLPAAHSARFRALRSGLLELTGIVEQVRYMGAKWQWAWEYGIGNRKLCWLHLMRGGLSATFTLSDSEEGRLSKGSKVASVLAKSILEGQRTGPLKWCWVELDDRRSVEAFLSLARRKAAWLAERPAIRRAPRLGRDEIEAD